MKTKMNQCFEKVRGAFFGVMIMGFVLSFVLTTCKSNEDDLPTEEQTELASVQGRFDGDRLVSLAVCRAVDGKSKSLKAATDEPHPVIRYAFDFVKISDAIHYVAKGVNFPLLNEVCGNGEIDVFLTSFETYEYADETKDMERRRPVVNDALIVFRGELGMYACMMNSGWPEMTEYSSHKRFGKNAVEKDFTPPLYQFYVKTEKNVISLACRNSNEFGSFPDRSLQWTKLQGGDIVSSQNLFSTEELTVMPEISQECTITEIGEDYLMVSGKYNLQKVFFDEYTQFVAGGQPVKLANFAKGDVITVTFDKLYEKYNPKVVLANKIAKK